jgi:sterol 24-C-methyltransferase
VQCKEGIEEGGGLPALAHYSEVVQDIKDAGFEVVEFYDANRGVHSTNEVPWYAALDGQLSSLSCLRIAAATATGRAVSHCAVWVAELLTFAAPGSTRAFLMLHQMATDLSNAGRMEIFTPSFYFLARKK